MSSAQPRLHPPTTRLLSMVRDGKTLGDKAVRRGDGREVLFKIPDSSECPDVMTSGALAMSVEEASGSPGGKC